MVAWGKRLRLIASAIVLSGGLSAGAGAATNPPLPLPYAAYGDWRSISDVLVSPDGNYVAFVTSDENGQKVLGVHASGSAGAAYRIVNPYQYAFSKDSHWLFVAGNNTASNSAALPYVLHAYHLVAGGDDTAVTASAYAWSVEGDILVTEQPSYGSGVPAPVVTVTELERKSRHTILGVETFALSDDGNLAAYSARRGPTNAVRVFDVRRQSDDATPMTCVSGCALKFARETHTLYAFSRSLADVHTDMTLSRQNLDGNQPPTATSFDLRPFVLQSNGGWDITPDGEHVIVDDVLPRKAGAMAPSVEVWNSRDAELRSARSLAERYGERAAYQAIITPASKTVVQITTPEFPKLISSDAGLVNVRGATVFNGAQPGEGSFRWAVVSGDDPHGIAGESASAPVLSPDGKFLLYWDAHRYRWILESTLTGTRRDLTSAIPTTFVNERWDRPGPKPSYGGAGWSTDGKYIILYDRYDAWAISLTNDTVFDLTQGVGRKSKVQLRYEDAGDRHTIDLDRPLLFNGIEERTKTESLFELSHARGVLTRLIKVDGHLSDVVRSQNGGTIAFVKERFDLSPDVWITKAPKFVPTRITEINPQQSLYRWGTAHLLTYTAARFGTMHALLFVPAGMSKRLPTMVVVYERQSDDLNLYRPPRAQVDLNVTRYVSHGYAVLMPDIAYDVGKPGESALACVLGAVRLVERMRVADPKRLGISGSSWGGYEVSYIVAHSNVFRAASGAESVSDLISAYNSILWLNGSSEQGYFEAAQGRMDGSLWQHTPQYIANSPIIHADRVNTPYLGLDNSEDSRVAWSQGMEWFLALRRLGKEAYLIDFPHESHNLTDIADARKWTRCLDEFFDHFLQGAPTPQWMRPN